MILRAVIADDEPPARKKIRRFLKGEDRFEIVGEAGDGLAAVALIERERPDVVFLDIQMPKLNGFEVLEALPEPRPRIVFITAYDAYAVKAFEVRALDYLLKPLEEDRFQAALARLQDPGGQPEQAAVKVNGLLRDWREAQPPLHRFLVRDRGKLLIVRVEEVRWIASEEKYVQLYVGPTPYLHRETLANLERRLDGRRFVRIHRGQIVNLAFVRELQPWSHGDYQVVLKDGTCLPLGRHYRRQFLEQFG